MSNHFRWFQRHQDWGIFLLRLFVGLRLIYGVHDNVLSWEHMIGFRDFLEQFHFPFPLLSAVVSVYLQLLAGICIIGGWFFRYSALLMILNFLIALIMVHRNDSIEGITPALAILFCCILFLFVGPGKLAIDKKG